MLRHNNSLRLVCGFRSFSYVIDSPQHMTIKVSLTTQEHVFLGNGQGLPIKSVGLVSFPSPTHSKTHLLLTNMLLVPT